MTKRLKSSSPRGLLVLCRLVRFYLGTRSIFPRKIRLGAFICIFFLRNLENYKFRLLIDHLARIFYLKIAFLFIGIWK